MSELEDAVDVLGTAKIYCVDDVLYRWNGSEIVRVGGNFTMLLAGEYDEVTGWKAYQYDERGQADYTKPAHVDVVVQRGCYPAYVQLSQEEYDELPEERQNDGTLWLIEE